MSRWTHVNGSIRVDWLFLGGSNVLDAVGEIHKAFGKTVSYRTMGLLPCTVPCGSEGSVQYSVVVNEDREPSDLSFCNVVIWGDLRDYVDAQAIYRWITDACKELTLIRSCVVKIEVEYGDTYLIYGSYENIKMIEVPNEDIEEG